ncbi:hypothetical protein PCANC_21618 [Puccinia coronata f. sp. avenae]|uniref:AB hydrolase-1 domain-containing protein n=1 Tax=Puccinia coronata f. sp. avenae TaxID=200324 RepID=A0A2N5S8A1_9BASI|nr:hypothetical protein PCASD_23169 [Puccinia coronata f. sp. avenae]PLW09464.1 hypothetical protein PCANC_21493 [Puccinia coronata f. sp. avenae]PLW28793.1 hypothetical protein PCANC_21618 [Puccinia coronata f. sp. avenae]
MRYPPENQLSHRPSILSLIPLAPIVQAAPSAEALAQIQILPNQPFIDISSDTRLASWTRSIHVFPAAFPRSISGSAVHQAVLPTYPRSLDHMSIAKDLRARLSAAEVTTEMDYKNVDEPQLFIAAARYVNPALEFDATGKHHSSDAEKPITLILAHANGFHKETWEPSLAHLILSPAGRKIKEIWALDCVNQGDSAVLNRQNLGLNFDWGDQARDLLQFVLCYLPDDKSSGTSLPVVLPRLECPNPGFLQLDRSPPSNTNEPIDWRHRKLKLIGHSFGGCASLLAATSIPELFHDVILVDPTVRPKHDTEVALATRMAGSAVSRHDQWENRTVALMKFQKNSSFYGRWDPHVLTRYVEHALESSGPVTLKCHKLHEASVFTQAHNRASESYFRFLDLLHTDHRSKDSQERFSPGSPPPSHRFFLILANQRASVTPEETACVFPSAVRMNRPGHLIVQETPMELALLICERLTASKPPAHIERELTYILSKL